jgi:3-oxoacyl-[acyl-carrier-protein] synthase-1
VLAEAAVAIILENQASIDERQVKPVAELLIGKSNSEGQGLFSLQDDGLPLAELIQDALHVNNLQASEIDLVIAHANGNQKSDDSEALAIKEVFGDKGIAVTGFKWLMGHTLCASGVIDAVMTTYALEHRCAPGIANLEQKATACAHLSLNSDHQDLKTPYAMMINRGFAGMNACLVIKACE